MKTLFLLPSMLLAALAGHAQLAVYAQVAPRPLADPGRALYREANAPPAATRLRRELAQQPGEFLNKGEYEVGYLYLLTGRRVLVPGLRYHLGQRVVQVQDSLEADSTRFWPLAALRGFDLGAEDEPASLRRYRPRLVREGRAADHREAVQVLTATDAGPLLLAWLPLPGAPAPALVAGPGNDPTEPLRPLELGEASVLRLCGPRAEQVRTFAAGKHLRFDQPADVAKILDYYNRTAVAK